MGVEGKMKQWDGLGQQGVVVAKEILEACEGSVVSLAAQLEARLNPAYSPRMVNERPLFCSKQNDGFLSRKLIS
jgi:hypothetical protein